MKGAIYTRVAIGYNYEGYVFCYFQMMGGMLRFSFGWLKEYKESYTKAVSCIKYKKEFIELFESNIILI